MQKRILWSAVLLAGISQSALADDEYYDTARVLSVTPQSERVNTPRQECRTEYIQQQSTPEKSPVGAIVGGIAGGLLGSQIGKGNGQIAGAAVGAGLGAVVGDRIGNNQTSTYETRPIERCVTVDNWQTVSRGYLVTYSYNGRDYTTVTDTDPGSTIKVRVNVGPVGSQPKVSYTPTNQVTTVVYREPVYVNRVYAAPIPPVNIYGGWGGRYYEPYRFGPGGHPGHGRGHGHGPGGHYPGW